MRLGRLQSSTDQSASICLSVLVVQSPLWPLFHHIFFLRTQDSFYLIELLGCRSSKKKKPLCGYFEDLFSPPAEQDPNIMETI